MRHRRRRRLQHLLFLWLAWTILATAVVVMLVLRLLQPGTLPFSSRLQQVTGFAAAQFAERWQDRPRLEAFASEVAEAFGVTLWLHDAAGQTLVQAGPPECHGWQETLAVQQAGEHLGEVQACFHRQKNFGPATVLAVLGTVCSMLWTAAALVARRITRPLSLLIGTTREIGAGNLGARVRLGRYQRTELGLLAESINDMAQRIERQMRDQRELLAAVSHEVRSPLTRLRMCAELLGTNAHDANALAALEREVEDLDTLVGKLLASSRLDFETLTKKQVVAADLCREVFARRRLDPSCFDDRSRGQKANLDPTLIARALDNLLDNAARHGSGMTSTVLRMGKLEEAPHGGSDAASDAVLAAALKDSEPGADGSGKAALIFEVCDRGPGFDPAALPRAFDAFYRGGPRRTEPGSLGLGLALVQRIALAHGGRAWAQNASGGGACVGFGIAL
jgi:two-component system OmpR family sensor kinase